MLLIGSIESGLQTREHLLQLAKRSSLDTCTSRSLSLSLLFRDIKLSQTTATMTANLHPNF